MAEYVSALRHIGFTIKSCHLFNFSFDLSPTPCTEQEPSDPHPGLMLIGRFASPWNSPGRPHSSFLRPDGSIIVPLMLRCNQTIPTGLFRISGDRSSQIGSHGGRKLVAPHKTDINRRAAYSIFKVLRRFLFPFHISECLREIEIVYLKWKIF